MTGPIEVIELEVTEEEVEAAARAWLEWQHRGRSWATAAPKLKQKFRDGARVVLTASKEAGLRSWVRA